MCVLSVHLPKVFELGNDVMTTLQNNTSMWPAAVLLWDYGDKYLKGIPTKLLMFMGELAMQIVIEEWSAYWAGLRG